MTTKTKAELRNGSSAEPLPLPGEPQVNKDILVPRITPRLIEVEIVGLTPLLVHAWSKKARLQMLEAQMAEKQQGRTKKKREPKNPEQDYKDSLYVSTEGWTGIPAGGIKGAMVNACRGVEGIPMTIAKRMIFVQAQGVTADGQQLVRVYGDHKMHEAMVRIDNGATADIRYRAIYPEWSIKLEIQFIESMISADAVCNLLELTGFIEGLCEHRPGAPKSNTGDMGRFYIKRK